MTVFLFRKEKSGGDETSMMKQLSVRTGEIIQQVPMYDHADFCVCHGFCSHRFLSLKVVLILSL